MSESNIIQQHRLAEGTQEPIKSPLRHPLTKVAISNFKRIREAEFEIGPVTYIIGGNNSGKSSAIQAIHTAVTAAQLARARQQRVIPTSLLRYSPAASFETVGHGKPLGNNEGGLRASVEFFSISNGEGDMQNFKVTLYRGRNYDSVGVAREPKQGSLADRIQDHRKLFSIYTPGLSGIPLREEYMSYASVFQRAAGGEANLVFRNILRLIDKHDKLADLEHAVSSLIGEKISLIIKADESHDFYIEVQAIIGGSSGSPIPIELWGTGLLQITQLYSYVILFEPSVFLVDEPDAHLHPSRQKLLASAFEDIAENYGCQIIATTHSEHLIFARPENTKLIWMREGTSEPYDNPDLFPLLMHLGCLDSINPREDQTILLTEDQNSQLLKIAADQLAQEGNNVTLISVNGVANLGVANIFTSLKEFLQPNTRIVIHRDRDFLTETEIDGWLKKVFGDSCSRSEVFITRYCDIESYYCTEDYISALFADHNDIRQLHQKILKEFEDTAREDFHRKRTANNKNCYLPEGGSPTNESIWPSSEAVVIDRVVGKIFLKRLKEQFQKQRLDITRIGKSAPEELLADLRDVLGFSKKG